MQKPLAGKIALVSGAGQNIGRAIALGLAEDGAAVIVNGRSNTVALEAVAAEIVARGGQALACRADVSKPEEVAGLVAEGVARFGGLDIVALSGISTHVGTPNRCHVSASKAGLEGLMRALAVELAPHRITCNSVSPGSIDTVRGVAAGARPGTLADSTIPAGRKGKVEEIAGLVRYLAGPLGAYVTGQTLHVNGGAFLT
jgi:3-oxoacyl-[acyl-carrier protein] reductase